MRGGGGGGLDKHACKYELQKICDTKFALGDGGGGGGGKGALIVMVSINEFNLI